MCIRQNLIEPLYFGTCDRCKSLQCDFYGSCIDDGQIAKCICQDSCADIYMPTCGSNGRTYDSVCLLQLESCRTKTVITVAKNGPCEESAQSNEIVLECDTNEDCPERSTCEDNKCQQIELCLLSTFGCCPDGVTYAKGPSDEGCSAKQCNCHPAGSYNQQCDDNTGQCNCRPGVIGLKCDSCAVGYWGINQILNSKNVGCIRKI